MTNSFLDDVYIGDTLDLQPVALGRTTEGWMIFEVPALNRPTALIIQTLPDETGTQAPVLSIELPAF